MRALSTGFRGAPNAYRFVRETLPTILDCGTTNATLGVQVLPSAGGADYSMAVIKIPAVRMADLVNVTEFSALFATFKVDKIETYLIPQWEGTVNPDYPTAGPLAIPGLMITRINTKYLHAGLTVSANAAAQRQVLAQIQKKSRSLYGSKKWLKLSTWHPHVPIDVSDGAGGTNAGIFPSPWLPLATATDQAYPANTTFFADTLSGIDIAPNIYRYRTYSKVHFRCSFVG